MGSCYCSLAMVRISINSLIFVMFIFLSACSDNGSGIVRGEFLVKKCNLESDDVDLEVDYFAATYFENTLSIRLQHTSSQQNFSDGLYFVISDVNKAVEHLTQPININTLPSISDFKTYGPSENSDENGYPKTPYHSLVRAVLYLYDTCSENPPKFSDGEGFVVFTHLYQPNGNKRIAGRFELEFIDPSTWLEPDNNGDQALVSGEFDFEYSDRKPEQPFL